MKDDFNGTKQSKVRQVALPAHRAHIFDAMSYREDGMQGRLNGVSEAYINAQYYFDVDVPAQTVAFTDWKDLPYGMADDTRALLKKTMEEEDRAEQRRRDEILKDRIVVSKVLRLKSPAG